MLNGHSPSFSIASSRLDPVTFLLFSLVSDVVCRGAACCAPSGNHEIPIAVSSRAKRGICFFLATSAIPLFVLLLPHLQGGALDTPRRPPILGISHVRIRVSALDKATQFYGGDLKLPRLGSGYTWPQTTNFFINAYQRIEILPGGDVPNKSMLAEISFLTADAAALHQYLLAHGMKPGRLSSDAHGGKDFEVTDPEQHQIRFVSFKGGVGGSVLVGPPISERIIHAGFVVHDRAVEDHFYKDILGFRLYWHGGMKDDEDRWVAMQVPDGTDWIEYMLNVPPDASHHTLGVMNHISLGVEDIHATEKQLIANGWKPGEAPKIGRDGKWQLNLYDPDDTRVEFMEFTPKEKPCCNPFTGPHPGPEAPSGTESRPK